MIIIPEFILLNAIEKGLAFVRKDYEEAVATGGESRSYLHRVLGGNKIGRYDYFTEAKHVFLAEIDDPRRLTVDLMYNMDVSKIPTIYIALAAEQSGQNGIGIDEGHAVELEYTNTNGVVEYTSVFTRRQSTNYTVMITSDNSNEVVMIYHFLRTLLISLTDHLSLSGIENITLGGQDLQLSSDLIPKNLFMRALTVKVEYDVHAPNVRSYEALNDMFFNGQNIKE